MTNIYTEEELKKWFKETIKKFPHSVMEQHLNAVESLMFDDFWKEYNVSNTKKGE